MLLEMMTAGGPGRQMNGDCQQSPLQHFKLDSGLLNRCQNLRFEMLISYLRISYRRIRFENDVTYIITGDGPDVIILDDV